MPDTEHTPKELGHLVRTTMEVRGVDLETAVEEVHAKIAKNGLKEWWNGIGRWAIKEAERDLLRRSDAPIPARAPKNPHAARPKSWRDRYLANPDLVLDIEVPVGQTGLRKLIRDLNQADYYAIKQFYVESANTMLFRGEYWGRIGDALEPDETTEEAWKAGRITRAHLDFLAERGRIDGQAQEGDDTAGA